MSAVHNFSAGPAKLPEAVLQRAQAELIDWQGRGVSVMEVSHRSDEFIALCQQSRRDLTQLLGIPDNYTTLFLQGGATLQFAMTALNLSARDDTIDFAITGSWGRKAMAEAGRFADVHSVATLESGQPMAPSSDWLHSPRSAYLHYTPNETIDGIEFHDVPSVPDDRPLVADYSSSILSRPIDVSQHGLIYAGAQKNIGPAGLTVVIVRNDLLQGRRSDVPELLRYQTHADAGSLRNTPPTFAWYLAALVFQWLLEQGGLPAMAARNQGKSETLYRAIDASDFYTAPVHPLQRSRMNVVFNLPNPTLETLLVEQAELAGLVGLKGHRSVGGLRASLYNAVSQQSVDALVDFLQAFERENG